MITTERWHHGSQGFGIDIAVGLFHVHGFGWSFELAWGDQDRGAGWVRRWRMRKVRTR